MRPKVISSLLFTVCFFATNAQLTTQDTIDNPYWQTMMFDRSNNFHDIVRAYELYFSNKPKVRGTGYKQFERWAENQKDFTDVNGNFLPNDHVKKELIKFKLNNLQTRSSSGNWINLGPFKNPLGNSFAGTGRLTSIAYHPTDQNTMYCGAPQGGLWRTTDKGANWVSSTDNLATLGVSDIAVLPTNGANPIILIGTGDRDANDASGLGVYRSTDGGITFTASNTGMGNREVNMFAVNEFDSSTIFAGTSNGIYVSYNSGLTWTKKSLNSSNYKDVKYCPGDTTTIYATTGGNFYRSTNSGNGWTNINSGLSSTTRNRIVIGVTPHNSNIVYLLASRSGTSGLESFYKSSNKGANFSSQHSGTPNIMGSNSSGTSSGGQGWYDIAIAVSPTDSNTIYTGGINVWRSTNGGATWSNRSHWATSSKWVHADIHYLGFHPISNELYVGTDGGVFHTNNGGVSWLSSNNGLSIGQIYNLGVSQLSKFRFISGFQDNTTLYGSNSNAWKGDFTGDGMHCEISNFDTSVMFGSIQYGNLRRTKNGGGSWQDIKNTISEYPGPWSTPYQVHPRVDNIMVAVYNDVWASKNVVTANSPSFSSISTGIVDDGTAVRFSNKNDSLVFFGWDNGMVRYSDNILDLNPTITSATKPNGNNDINDIETSYTDENTIYVCSGTRVYKSINKGSTWTNITSNLPSITMRSIVLDKNSNEGLYVGTNAGVYYKDATSTNWSLFNTGLPLNSSIRDLEIVYDTVCSSSSKLFAATYGRGLWVGDLKISQVEPIIDIVIPTGECATVPVPLTNSSTQVSGLTQWEWTVTPSAGVTYVMGTNNSSQGPILSFANPGTYTIKVKATNPNNGFCTKTYTNAINIGSTGNMEFLNGLDGDTVICPSDTVIVSVKGMDNYSWEMLGGMSQVNDSTYKLFPASNTTYRIFGDINSACFDTLSYTVNMLPIPFYGITTSNSNKNEVCVGDTITYTFTGIDSSVWFPEIEIDTSVGNQIKVFPSTTRIYDLTLKSAGFCDVKINQRVKALLNPTLNYTSVPDSVICNVDTANLVELNLPSKVFTPNTDITMVSNVYYKLHPTNTQTYLLTTSDTNYCPRVYDTINIRVKTLPNISLDAPSEICIGDSSLLTASGADAYQWTPNTYLSANTGGSVWTKPTDSIEYTITGFSNNCSSTIMHKIIVGKDPVTLTVDGERRICDGQYTDLVASGASNYLWSPDNVVHNKFSDRVRVSTNTSMTLRVIGSNTGCGDTMDIPIQVYPQPTILLSSDVSAPICEGDSATITANGALSYTIAPQLNTSMSTNTFTVAPQNTTKYTIFGTDVNNCQSSEDIEILVTPKPEITISPKVSTLDYGDIITIFAIGADNIEWSPRKFIIDSSENDRIKIQPTEDIVYRIKGTSEGCESEGIAIVYVLQNGDNSDSTDSTSSSISNVNFANITVYPNPTSTLFNLESSQEKISFNLFNYAGEKVAFDSKYSRKHIIYVDQLAKGMYMLELISEENKSRYIKVQVR